MLIITSYTTRLSSQKPVSRHPAAVQLLHIQKR